MSDPTKPPSGSPFPDGSQQPPPGSPFPAPPPNQYQQPLPPSMNVRESAGWKWSPLIGITYNGFPVGLVFGVIVLLLIFASK